MSPSPPRSKGCSDAPSATDLKRLLQAAPAQNGDAGGLNHGKAMWGAVVDRDGQLCALAVSTEDLAATWPGSRGIAIAKASTANAFSTNTAPMSTARLYTLSQPGHSLWGAANGNPLNPFCQALANDTTTGLGKVCGAPSCSCSKSMEMRASRWLVRTLVAGCQKQTLDTSPPASARALRTRNTIASTADTKPYPDAPSSIGSESVLTTDAVLSAPKAE